MNKYISQFFYQQNSDTLIKNINAIWKDYFQSKKHRLDEDISRPDIYTIHIVKSRMIVKHLILI